MRRFFTEFKPLYHISAIGFVVGIVVGSNIFESIYGGLFAGGPMGIIFGLMIGMFFQNNDQLERLNLTDFKNDINYVVHYFLDETSQFDERALRFYERTIARNYDEKIASKAAEHIRSLKNSKYSINNNFSHIIHNYSFQNKKKVLMIVIGVALSDRYLTKTEENLIFDIAEKLRFPSSAVEKILGLYNFTTEQEHRNQNQNRQRKKNESHTFSKQRLFFEVLHLTENASIDDIKKSYRKLMKKYHPDRLVDATDVEKEIAKEEFQKIQDAYEYLKELKGF